MKILNTPLDIIQAGQKPGGTAEVQKDNGTGFAELLKNSIDDVNALQQQSSEMKSKLVTGEITDLHQVTIAAEKSSLAFQLSLQIRNKVIEAYQEIMRMQV